MIKLDLEKFMNLRQTGQGFNIYRAGFAPCMMFGFGREEGQVEIEFAWSGLQVISTNEVARKMMEDKGVEPFALEGVGYLSIKKSITVPCEDEPGLFFEDQNALVTSFISNIIASCMNQSNVKEMNGLIIIQLAPPQIVVPEDCEAVGVHIMVPVTEETWKITGQTHALACRAGDEYYKRIKGDTAPGVEIAIGDLSAKRILN